MEIYYSFDDIPRNENHIITVGTFDGVHRGHQKILARLNEIAKNTGGKSLIVTFHPHPQTILKKQDLDPIKLLTTLEERIILFQKFNIDSILVAPFTLEFASTPAEVFVEKYLWGKVGFSHIFVGYDHSFGKNRKGNYELLLKYSQTLGFTVEKIPAHIENEITVSSTKIRKAISEANIELANKLLGYDYFIKGKVVRGDGRGVQLGFPTANISFSEDNKLLPPNGVYLVYSEIFGRKFFGAANIGVRPTFYTNSKKILEVYYLDFNADLYNLELIVHFKKFIRYEQRFNSIDGLLAQMQKDKEYCLKLIEKMNI